MQFRTIVDIPAPTFSIGPCEEMLFVGSCFADNIGRRFRDEMFRATVNPYGVMYNPASILHTVRRTDAAPRVAVFTLGTNHVYILKSTGEIVDNCQKRPQRLFEERELSIDECVDYLRQAVGILRGRRPDVQVIVTVSPIRYAKYGYHGSQLSKATLLLAAERLVAGERKRNGGSDSSVRGGGVTYFPAYEIVNDELRDYRFYADDMLHPSAVAVEYIWQRMVEVFFSDEAKAFMKAWAPIKRGLAHRPLHPDSAEYKAFRDKLMADAEELKRRYPAMPSSCTCSFVT